MHQLNFVWIFRERLNIPVLVYANKDRGLGEKGVSLDIK